jgi:hypothetical protein
MILLNKEVYDYIRSADSDTLNLIIEELKKRQSVIQQEAGSEFSVGQSVTFPTRNGLTQSGLIEKINRKTIIVRTDAYKTWRVSPSLLKPDNFYAGT